MRTRLKHLIPATLCLLLACSGADVVRLARVAATGDAGAIGDLAVDKAVGYATRPDALRRDLERTRREFDRLFQVLGKAIEAVWGRKETRTPEKRRYVKYLENYRSRALVDFDRGKVTVETIDQKTPRQSLKRAIVTTLLAPNDPRAIDLFSAKAVEIGETPFLFNEVHDHEGKPIRWQWRAERYADHLLAGDFKQRPAQGTSKTDTIHYVSFPLVADHLQVRARKYRQLVTAQARRFGVSRNLVYAIIKTESDFNPFAVSKAPAYGLMQVVPATAGQDVHRFLKRKGMPEPRFLLDPANNIEYGTAYLHILTDAYLSAIDNPVSRQYCVIAAYNGGAGSVLRTFAKDRQAAAERISQLPPLEVYRTLRQKHPYAETRRYLEKVLAAQKQFVNL